MNVMFLNVPAYGHVIPSLALLAELTRRGHQVSYFITEQFRAAVEAAGAQYQPYSLVHDDFFAARGLDGSRPQRTANTLQLTAAALLPELQQFARQAHPDVIVYDSLAPWGYFLARTLNLPGVVSLCLMPLPESPLRLLTDMTFLAGALPMLLRDLDQGREAVRRSQALGKQVQVAPLGFAQLLNPPGELIVSYTSSAFVAYGDAVSPNVRYVGWTLNDRPAETSFSFAPWEGRRLIYVSLGTLMSHNAAFFRTCIDAFAGREEMVVISTGKQVDPAVFGALPANIAVYPWVPQAAMLKRASLFISHAGLNSVHDSLYLGVPLLLVPQQDEQTLTARRVAELGAGLLLRRAQVTAERLRSTAARLLNEPRFRAAASRIGATLRADEALRSAVIEIEAFGAHTPVDA